MQREARAVRFAGWVYAAVLRVLPTGFRRVFEPELRGDFVRIARHSHQRAGAPGVLLTMARGVGDVLLAALRYRGRGVSCNERDELWRPRRGRRAQPGEAMMRWMNDVRFAARTLARRPGFTSAAALTLGLGIGATVAIFAVVDAILIRPLPYPDSHEIVLIDHHAPGLNLPDMQNSEGTLRLYQQHARSFSAVARAETGYYNLTGPEQPARIRTAEVSPEFFDVIRVMPVKGRRFIPADGIPGAASVAILTETGWQARFARDPDVVGRKVVLDGVPTEIVGLMPDGFSYPNPEIEILLARGVDPNGSLSAFGVSGIARLGPGVTIEAAQSDVTALQSRLTDLDPGFTAEFMKRVQWSATVSSLRDERVKDVRTALWVVFGTVGFVLLIACANVANLFLVRAESRQRELAVRSAMGASRGRIAWLFLFESLLLGLAGGVVGTAVAAIAVRSLVAVGPAQLPRLHEVAIDPRAIAFATSVSLLVGLAFGLIALTRYARPAMGLTLREGRSDTGTRERHALRNALIAAQVALALVLLVGSGLMVRSFSRLSAVDPGVRIRDVITIGVSVEGSADRVLRVQAYRDIVARVAALPGVKNVGALNSLPIEANGLNGGSFDIESMPRAEGEIPPVVMYSAMTDGAFEALGIPLRKGRSMERRDNEVSPSNLVWVNETFARQFFRDREAVGQRIRLDGNNGTWLEIAGVVGDVRTFGLDKEPRPFAYLPLTTPVRSAGLDIMKLAIHTSAGLNTVLPAVRATIASSHPHAPIMTAMTMEEIVARSIASTSFTMTVLGIAALLALVLGAIGLYGVITYVVAQRTREIGIRIALGATPEGVLLLVVRQGLGVVLLGLGIGLMAALALTRLLEGLLFNISARDPLTFAAVIVVLVAVSLVASYLPARRAAMLSPLEALATD